MSMSHDDLVKAARDETTASALNKKIGSLYSLYYNLWSSTSSYGAAEKTWGTPTHRMLRQTYKKSQIDKLIILTRKHQVRHVSRRVIVKESQKGWMIQHFKADDPTWKNTPDIERRCLEVSKFIEQPRKDIHPNGFTGLLNQLVEAALIIDRVAMVNPRDSMGKAREFHLLPPDDIKPRLEVLLSFMNQWRIKNEDAVLNRIFKEFGVDAGDAAYIQEVDGRVHGAWSADDISLLITNPSSELNTWGYSGGSALEESMELTTLLLQGFSFNTTQFTNNAPEVLTFLEGDFDPTGLEIWKRQMMGQMGQAGNQRFPFLVTGSNEYKVNVVKIRDSMREMQFPMLIRMALALKCAAYRLHPSSINMSADMGRERAMLPGDTHEDDKIAAAQEEGYHSLLGTIAAFITENLVIPWYDDLRFVFTVQDQESKEQTVQLWTQKTQTFATIDEARAAQGLEPLDKATDGRLTGEVINNPVWLQAQQMKRQAETENMNAQMGIPPGPAGQVAQAGMMPQQGQQQGQGQDGFSGMDDEPTPLPGYNPPPPKGKGKTTSPAVKNGPQLKKLARSLAQFEDELIEREDDLDDRERALEAILAGVE
jgi:hypothetical protein